VRQETLPKGQQVVSLMILILQVLIVVALASCASRVISEAAEWFFFGRATQDREDQAG